MLKLRGIDLGREPHDIDIIVKDYAPKIKIPESLGFKETGTASDGHGAKYESDGIILDVLSSQEEHEMVDGIRLGNVEILMQAKYRFSLQDYDGAKKHHDDLVKMEFMFPGPIKDDEDELPF
ncbi:MAG: hypothetical protein ACEPOW_13975 [Bacteroidales bacterium]